MWLCRFEKQNKDHTRFILSECAIANEIPHFVSTMIDMNSYTVISYTHHTPCFHCVFDRERLDSLISSMRENTENYQKDPLAVVATSLFQSTSIVVNEVIKYVLRMNSPSYTRFF
jgi:hypothetical protein